MKGDPIRVLYVGEGENVLHVVTKSSNSYMFGEFYDESQFLKKALTEYGGIEVTHLFPHQAVMEFPATDEALETYDVVILSDVGSESILFYPYLQMQQTPIGNDRLRLVHDFVESGGGMIMIGGWSSFGGYQGQARYAGTPVERALPVSIKDGDDRVEMVEGCSIEPGSIAGEHPVMAGLDWGWGKIIFTGYNRFEPKEGAQVLARFVGGDACMAAWQYGRGRAAAFASDCAPHWAGNFVNWDGYGPFWRQTVQWLGGK